MIISVSAAVTLILSILAVFFDLILLKIAISVFLFLIVVLSFISRAKGVNNAPVREKENKGDSDELKRLAARLKETEEAYRSLQRESREDKEKLETLIEGASYLNTALPMMKQLAGLVVDKTEESAMNLTENIFEISNRSSQVGNHISNFLNDLFSGDKSLKSNIDILSGEMNRINKLIEDFTAISKRYTLDMKQIDENVKTIKGFLDGIRDVSDRTGLLAINSSIEAARVGNAGKGFSVLAGEIQGLASSSKEISLQIEDVIAGISDRVDESFQALESEINMTLEQLNRTRSDLQEISSSLDDKIADVENHVKDSDSLSRTVTEQLGNVTVNMQYQDITRQILEHIMSTLNFYRTRMEENEPLLVAASEKKEKRDEILEKISSYFTIEDEWKLFGLQVHVGKSSDSDQEEEFKGNVEMF
ncbi:methyl-accepting chemotaxis protein [Spirochaeta isovalerica]|uniref:Methyl-accepting chemotaxis protein n=1 Tax=Spirochaeta isovalerica TaxID=150 RepID=A0A841RC06_9SPIO|nr:methyl-accepting chemotaxis protein [Spirochaeta isovalerica]MBB6481473.1 methyl-accepting chemotaxis protein [Spirochaeta isovalerica]